jgi:hypothetical protein
MSRLWFLPLLLLAGCGGLRDHAAHAGWRFEVLKPPTIASESLVQCGGNDFRILGAGSGGEFESLRFAIGMILRRLDSVERATVPKTGEEKSAPMPKKCP